jgi:hypothetical protein
MERSSGYHWENDHAISALIIIIIIIIITTS